MDAPSKRVYVHLPVAWNLPPQNPQRVSVGSPRVHHQGVAQGYRQVQLPREHLPLPPAVARDTAKVRVRVVQSELAPSQHLRSASLNALNDFLLQRVVVRPRGLRVAAKGDEDLGMRQRQSLGTIQAFGVATLGDAALKVRAAEHVGDAIGDVCTLLVVPSRRGEAQAGRGLLLPRVKGVPRPEIVQIHGHACNRDTTVPLRPGLGAFAEHCEPPPQLVAEVLPRGASRQEPHILVPGGLVVAQPNSRLRLLGCELVPQLLPSGIHELIR
mmetsp:Transcript_12613/g.33958  ORF Transcript_12613/g.33958 Transcript_12613/m.33958 type:complete len:270 (-) Transcript_12613:227-1036(-)